MKARPTWLDSPEAINVSDVFGRELHHIADVFGVRTVRVTAMLHLEVHSLIGFYRKILLHNINNTYSNVLTPQIILMTHIIFRII